MPIPSHCMHCIAISDSSRKLAVETDHWKYIGCAAVVFYKAASDNKDYITSLQIIFSTAMSYARLGTRFDLTPASFVGQKREQRIICFSVIKSL